MILNPSNRTKLNCPLSTALCQLSIINYRLSIGVILILLFLSFSNQTYSQSWHTYFGDTLHNGHPCPGVNCPSVHAIYVDGDSLFITGPFGYAGNLPLWATAKWHNYNWYNLNITESNNYGKSIKRYKNKLFVGGSHMELNNMTYPYRHLYFWDGDSWHPPGPYGTQGGVWGLKVFNDTLFACGRFTGINGVAGLSIMAYDNNEWIHIGNLDVAQANDFAMFNNELLVATFYSGIFKRTGATTWKSFQGSPGSVNTMTVDTFNNFLYIGGAFHYVADTLFSRCVAMWDGFQWHSLDNGVVGDVNALEIYHGDLYIGGVFSETSNGLELNRIGRWDGEQWHDLHGGVWYGFVWDLAVFQDTLIVGGSFFQVGIGKDSLRALAIAKWHMPPPEDCRYLQPVLYAYEEFGTARDTFYLNNGVAEVKFYNNNAYIDTWEWDFGDGGTADVKEPVYVYTDIGYFNVSVTITHNECIKTAEKTVYIKEDPLMIHDYEKITFNIYPNPTQQNFIVETDLWHKSNTEIRITTTTGNHIKTKPINSPQTEINTSGWSKGTYICSLYVGKKLVESRRIVVE